jgi:hypothetical protein
MCIALIGCGGEDESAIDFATSVRAQEPTCGLNCPDSCWVDISGPGNARVGDWFIFKADTLPLTPLENAVVRLQHGGGSWQTAIADCVPASPPVMLHCSYSISSSFDVTQSGMTAKVELGSPEDPLVCGYVVL